MKYKKGQNSPQIVLPLNAPFADSKKKQRRNGVNTALLETQKTFAPFAPFADHPNQKIKL